MREKKINLNDLTTAREKINWMVSLGLKIQNKNDRRNMIIFLENNSFHKILPFIQKHYKKKTKQYLKNITFQQIIKEYQVEEKISNSIMKLIIKTLICFKNHIFNTINNNERVGNDDRWYVARGSSSSSTRVVKHTLEEEESKSSKDNRIVEWLTTLEVGDRIRSDGEMTRFIGKLHNIQLLETQNILHLKHQSDIKKIYNSFTELRNIVCHHRPLNDWSISDKTYPKTTKTRLNNIFKKTHTFSKLSGTISQLVFVATRLQITREVKQFISTLNNIVNTKNTNLKKFGLNKSLIGDLLIITDRFQNNCVDKTDNYIIDIRMRSLKKHKVLFKKSEENNIRTFLKTADFNKLISYIDLKPKKSKLKFSELKRTYLFSDRVCEALFPLLNKTLSSFAFNVLNTITNKVKGEFGLWWWCDNLNQAKSCLTKYGRNSEYSNLINKRVRELKRSETRTNFLNINEIYPHLSFNTIRGIVLVTKPEYLEPVLKKFDLNSPMVLVQLFSKIKKFRNEVIHEMKLPVMSGFFNKDLVIDNLNMNIDDSLDYHYSISTLLFLCEKMNINITKEINELKDLQKYKNKGWIDLDSLIKSISG